VLCVLANSKCLLLHSTLSSDTQPIVDIQDAPQASTLASRLTQYMSDGRQIPVLYGCVFESPHKIAVLKDIRL
jgi:hypothetical protein